MKLPTTLANAHEEIQCLREEIRHLRREVADLKLAMVESEMRQQNPIWMRFEEMAKDVDGLFARRVERAKKIEVAARGLFDGCKAWAESDDGVPSDVSDYMDELGAALEDV